MFQKVLDPTVSSESKVKSVQNAFRVSTFQAQKGPNDNLYDFRLQPYYHVMF